MKRQHAGLVDTSVDTFKAESVNLSAEAIGARIKEARKALGLTQDALAALAGAKSKSGLQDNEAGKNMPGGQMIGALARAGINTNWLLTGEGPMLSRDLSPPTVSEAHLDLDRLALAIEATEEGLEAAQRTMKPKKKAELILAVYELLEEPSISKERVLKLVKLAA